MPVTVNYNSIFIIQLLSEKNTNWQKVFHVFIWVGLFIKGSLCGWGVVECDLLFHLSMAYLCDPVSLALEAHETT